MEPLGAGQEALNLNGPAPFLTSLLSVPLRSEEGRSPSHMLLQPSFSHHKPKQFSFPGTVPLEVFGRAWDKVGSLWRNDRPLLVFPFVKITVNIKLAWLNLSKANPEDKVQKVFVRTV